MNDAVDVFNALNGKGTQFNSITKRLADHIGHLRESVRLKSRRNKQKR
jgi:hypothetical protein